MTRLAVALLLPLAFVLPASAGLHDPAVTGTVLDEQGAPLAGARVALEALLSAHESGRRRLAGRERPPAAAAVTTDAAGRFVLAAPAIGAYDVVARAPGRVAMVHGPLLLLERVSLPPAVLPTDGSARARVLGTAGRPVAGAWVAASPDRYARDAPTTGGEPASVSVRVTLRDGTPVPGLIARAGEGFLPLGATGADGELTLPVPPSAGALEVHLFAADGRQRRYRLERPRADAPEPAPTRWLFPRALAVRGRVLGADGRPLRDAVVWSRSDPARVVPVGRDGSYALTVPAGGRLPLVAAAPGHVAEALSLGPAHAAAGRAPTVALERAAGFRGVVTGPDGRPIAGAAVEAVHPAAVGPREHARDDPAAERAETAADGVFVLRRLRAEQEYELRVRNPGHLPEIRRAVAGFAPSAAGEPFLRIALRRSCALRGRVEDREGAPIAEAAVVVRPAVRAGREERLRRRLGEADERRAAPGDVEAASDASGRFAVAASPAGRIDVEVRRPGFAPTFRRGVELAGERAGCEAPVDLGPFVLRPGARVEGRVVARGGAPVPGAEVFLAERAPREGASKGTRGRTPDATTDRAGGFVLDDLPEGEPRHLVVAAAGHRTEAVLGVRPPTAEPLLVRLDPVSSLRGRVVDEEDEPVAGARVHVEWRFVLPDDPLRRPSGDLVERIGTTGGDGVFEVADVPAGAVTLAVSTDEHAPLDGVEVRVPQAADDPELVLVLREGARLEGRVSTDAGDPVEGARVAGEAQTGVTDAEGRYAISGLAAGEETVRLFHPDYPRQERVVRIEEGVNVLDFELPAGTEVTGRVVDAAGEEVAGATVALAPLDRFRGSSYRARSGEDGGFRLAPVAAGRYRLQGEADGFAGGGDAIAVTVAREPVGDLELVLVRGAVVHGAVIGLSDAELAQVTVSAHGPEGEERPARTDADGRYEVAGPLTPGDWRLRAALWEGERSVEVRVPIAPSDREVVRDLELGDRAALSGHVLHGDGPLAGATVSIRGERFEIERSVTSGHDGRFAFRDLEADRYWLGVKEPELRLVHNETLDVAGEVEVVVRLESGSVAGRVRDAESAEPVMDALVSLRPTVGADFLIADSTRADGAFHLVNVPAGEYRLEVVAPGFEPVRRELRMAPGEALLDLDLALARAAGLELDVRLAAGTVPPAIHVVVFDASGAVSLRGSYAPRPDGVFVLASAPARSGRIAVGAPGGAVATVDLTRAGSAAPVRVTLPPAGRLRVEVPALAAESRLAALTLLGPDGARFWTLGPGGTVESEWVVRGGRSTVDGVPVGTWTAIVQASDGRTWSGAAVVSDRTESTVELF